MLTLWHFLLAFALLDIQHATALPQGISPSQSSQTTAAMSTGTSTPINNRTCEFDSMNKFFDYANKNSLNITTEVQHCQNLCLLTYGVGNPDLSGIGMMYAYSIQTGLTILIGPIYRLLHRTLAAKSSFIRDLRDLQISFFSANGFFVGSSALATLIHLSQNPSTFEIAEMQAMAFLQVNSILLTFFCLVVAQPLSRWAARVLLYFAVFVLVIVALGESHLNSDSRANWRLASDGCAHSSTDYNVINPVLYPSWAVAIFAVAGTFAYWLQSLSGRFQGDKLHRSLFRMLTLFWVLLLGLLVAGMVIGLTMMWRQRHHLRSLARDQFEDDEWGFGQIAALTIWAPILVELLYMVNDLVQRKSARWNRWNQTLSTFFSPEALQKDQGGTSPKVQSEVKGQAMNGTAVEIPSNV